MTYAPGRSYVRLTIQVITPTSAFIGASWIWLLKHTPLKKSMKTWSRPRPYPIYSNNWIWQKKKLLSSVINTNRTATPIDYIRKELRRVLFFVFGIRAMRLLLIYLKQQHKRFQFESDSQKWASFVLTRIDRRDEVLLPVYSDRKQNDSIRTIFKKVVPKRIPQTKPLKHA